MKKNEAQRPMGNDARVAILETAFININGTLLDLKRSLDKMDSKFESKFDTLHNRLWSNFLWLMSMIIGLAGLIAHTQHWF